MKSIIPFILLVLIGNSALGQEATEPADTAETSLITSGEAVDLGDFLWKKRPLVIFADTSADPRFVQQMAYILARIDDLARRDVIVLTDTNPAAESLLRKTLRPRDFTLVLIGKDGRKYLRKPFPWHVREITRVIDKMPVRQQEIRDGLAGNR